MCSYLFDIERSWHLKKSDSTSALHCSLQRWNSIRLRRFRLHPFTPSPPTCKRSSISLTCRCAIAGRITDWSKLMPCKLYETQLNTDKHRSYKSVECFEVLHSMTAVAPGQLWPVQQQSLAATTSLRAFLPELFLIDWVCGQKKRPSDFSPKASTVPRQMDSKTYQNIQRRTRTQEYPSWNKGPIRRKQIEIKWRTAYGLLFLVNPKQEHTQTNMQLDWNNWTRSVEDFPRSSFKSDSWKRGSQFMLGFMFNVLCKAASFQAENHILIMNIYVLDC